MALVISQEGFCVVTLDNPLLISGSGAFSISSHRTTVKIFLFVIIPGPSGLLLLSCELVLRRYGRHEFGFSNTWTRTPREIGALVLKKIWEESETHPNESWIGPCRNFSHQWTTLGGDPGATARSIGSLARMTASNQDHRERNCLALMFTFSHLHTENKCSNINVDKYELKRRQKRNWPSSDLNRGK